MNSWFSFIRLHLNTVHDKTTSPLLYGRVRDFSSKRLKASDQTEIIVIMFSASKYVLEKFNKILFFNFLLFPQPVYAIVLRVKPHCRSTFQKKNNWFEYILFSGDENDILKKIISLLFLFLPFPFFSFFKVATRPGTFKNLPETFIKFSLQKMFYFRC